MPMLAAGRRAGPYFGESIMIQFAWTKNGCMGNITKRLRTYSHDTFSSLYIRNYRLYYIGQVISTSGTFMQSVAQAWLVLQLTNSGAALGIASALQYLPILVLGPDGGVLADRLSTRKIL